MVCLAAAAGRIELTPAAQQLIVTQLQVANNPCACCVFAAQVARTGAAACLLYKSWVVDV
jgi:hypothetical protein